MFGAFSSWVVSWGEEHFPAGTNSFWMSLEHSLYIAKVPTLLCYWMQWFSFMIAVWPLPMLDPLILADHTWVPLIVYSLTIFPSPLSSIPPPTHSQVHIFLLLWIAFSRTCYTYVMIVVSCVWTFPLFIMILRFLHNVYVCIWGCWIEIHWAITQLVFSFVDRHLGCF